MINLGPVLKTARGHLGLDLLNFDSSKMDGFESEDDEEALSTLKSFAKAPTKKYDEAQQQKDESDPLRNWLDEVDPAEYTNDYHGMNPDDYYEL